MPQDDKHSTDNQDTEQLAAIDDATLAEALSSDLHTLTCPNCGKPCRLGETTCAQCGIVFDALLEEAQDDKTFALKAQVTRRSAGEGSWPRIGAIPDAPVTIILEIGGQPLLLPQAEVTIAGREIPGDSDLEAYLDLSPYGARENGVSRNHVRFVRKETLLYVADLGSTNGTFLNGRRLLVNVERLLRNDDELQLGYLKLKVKYT